MSQITVISGPERRRVWTDQQRLEPVAVVSEPGANVAAIARGADLRPNQIYRWGRQRRALQRCRSTLIRHRPLGRRSLSCSSGRSCA